MSELKYFDAFARNAFFDSVASLPKRKNNDGKGRAADAVAKKFGVCVSTVYQARKVLRTGHFNIVSALRNGDIFIKTAYKKLLKGDTSVKTSYIKLKKKENAMNINGFEELSYLKNFDSLSTEIKNIEKLITDAGCSSEINPRFYVENNKISFDMRISIPFSPKPAK